MIAMGAGTNHWFHSDEIYRTFLALVLLCGCQGKNGGGWAHYVGQEKVRPLTGFQTVAFALRLGAAAAAPGGDAVLLAALGPVALRGRAARGSSPRRWARGAFGDRHIADMNALAARLGWLPSFPSFDRIEPRPGRRGRAGRASTPPSTSSRSCATGRLRFACEDPDAAGNHPRILTVWRANLLGSSGKGHEYFLKHMLGTAEPGVRAEEAAPEQRPRDVDLAGGARGEARPVHDDRLPDDLERALLGRRPAGGDVVREARPLDDRPAPVRAHLQPGHPAAVGGAHRLGRVHG